jgi:hypothetical protein
MAIADIIHPAPLLAFAEGITRFQERYDLAGRLLRQINGLNPKTRIYFSVTLENWRRQLKVDYRIPDILELSWFLMVNNQHPRESWSIRLKTFNRAKAAGHKRLQSQCLALNRSHAAVVLAALAYHNPIIVLPLLCPLHTTWKVVFSDGSIQTLTGHTLAKIYATLTTHIPVPQSVLLRNQWRELKTSTGALAVNPEALQALFNKKRVLKTDLATIPKGKSEAGTHNSPIAQVHSEIETVNKTKVIRSLPPEELQKWQVVGYSRFMAVAKACRAYYTGSMKENIEPENDNSAILTQEDITHALNKLAASAQLVASDYASSLISDPFTRDTVPLNGAPFILKIPLKFHNIPINPEYRTKEQRTAAFLYSEELTRQLELEISRIAASETSNIDEYLYRAVNCFPSSLFSLSNAYEIPIGLFNILHEHIYYCFKIQQLLVRPDPNLSVLLDGYPEYVFHQLSVSRKPSPVTDNLSQNMIRSLFRHPFWAQKAIQRWGPSQGAELLRSIAILKEYDGMAALADSLINPATDVSLSAITTRLESILAYVTLHPNKAAALSLTEIELRPLWTYNWLKITGQPRTPAMTELLVKWVPWGIQYLYDCKPADTVALLHRIKTENTNPYWKDWLDLHTEVTILES